MKVAHVQKEVADTGYRNPLISLRSFTSARIALGRTGTSVPLKESLSFKLAHAYARDAVYSTIDLKPLTTALQSLRLPCQVVKSKVVERQEYLKRPDLGRQLSKQSRKQLKQEATSGFDVVIVLADGLSATAINNNAIPLLKLLIKKLTKANYTIAPIVIAEQARVAIADEIAALLKAKLSIILIGERPGLSSPNSLGAYLTYDPKIKMTDEMRNCISNIRPEGVNFRCAANKIFYLVQQAFERKLTGVELKEEMNLLDH